MKRFGVLGIALCLAATAATAARAETISLEVSDGRLSLEAEQVSLRTLLDTLGESAGFTVEVRGRLGGMVSPSIHGQPLAPAIGRLLDGSPHSFFLEFAKQAAGPAKLSRLVVIAGAPGTPRPPDEAAPREDLPAVESDETPALEAAAWQEAMALLEGALQGEDPAVREAAAEAMTDLETLQAIR